MNEESLRTMLDQFHDFMRRFLASKEIPAEEIPDSNEHHFTVSDAIPLSITYLDDCEEVLLFAELPPVYPHNRAVVYGKLLEANHGWRATGGATISLDPDLQIPMLAYQVPMQGLEFPDFQALVENFTQVAEVWTELLCSEEFDSEQPAAEPDPPARDHIVRP